MVSMPLTKRLRRISATSWRAVFFSPQHPLMRINLSESFAGMVEADRKFRILHVMRSPGRRVVPPCHRCGARADRARASGRHCLRCQYRRWLLAHYGWFTASLALGLSRTATPRQIGMLDVLATRSRGTAHCRDRTRRGPRTRRQRRRLCAPRGRCGRAAEGLHAARRQSALPAANSNFVLLHATEMEGCLKRRTDLLLFEAPLFRGSTPKRSAHRRADCAVYVRMALRKPNSRKCRCGRTRPTFSMSESYAGSRVSIC